MHRLKLSFVLVAALTVAAAAYFLWMRGIGGPNHGGKPQPRKSPTTTATTQHSVGEPAKKTSAPLAEQTVAARTHLHAVADALRARRNPEDVRKILADLRAFLEKLPKHLAAAAVVDFLDERTDAPTGLEFSVGSGGVLTDATSLRVFLLDLLAALDPPTAGSYAAKILQIPTSPDEWAIGMRNYARAYPTPEANTFLRSKAAEMIQNAGWLANPSGGFLEAFDVFVHTRDTAATPLLARLVRDRDQRAAAHAAYLTLDRLVIAEPQAVFAQIEQQPDMLKGRELMQSNFFARADVRDDKQRLQVESYLLDAARTSAELEAFAGIYPNANFMISQNLLTSIETPKHAELAIRDRAALKVANEWLADPRFQQIKPHIATIRNRLQTFVSQTETRSQ